MGSFINAIPGAIGQGLIWGIMAIGVYITFRVLDFADLTVDGTLATGGATLVTAMMNGVNVYVALVIAFAAGCLAGLVTGLLNTVFGIPPILAGILTQLALYSINLRILGKANQPVSSYKYHLLCTMSELNKALLVATAFVLVIIAILYWFFGTEVGHAIRATGTNMNMARANGININSSKILALLFQTAWLRLQADFWHSIRAIPILIWAEVLSLSVLRLLSSARCFWARYSKTLHSSFWQLQSAVLFTML